MGANLILFILLYCLRCLALSPTTLSNAVWQWERTAFLLNDKNSKAINHFWELQQIFQAENMYSEEKAYLRQTQHILNTTRETFSQNLKFQQTVIKQHLFGETNDEDSESIIGQKRNCGSAFPKNKGHESDSDDRERRYRQNSPQKRQCIEPIADAENNPFFESENNLDKEKAKSKSQYISSPENENTPLIHNDVEDESQQCNDDEVSLNSYDEDYYSNCELSEEVKRLDVNDALIRNIFLEVLHQFRSKDLESGKSIMDSNFLNGIIDITDSREGHDIAQQLMTHFSVCLEAPTNSESKSPNLERTFAIDTTIYIVNRLFRMHQDVLDRNWMEMLTADTKNHKIDGTLIVLKIRKKDHQTIGIVEFSRGKKAPDSKDVDDKVKLSRNAMRILNKLLETISCERARVYTIQCVNG
ncbi:unnamed protein product [Rhizophagus irregularis]|nr:unnamed protein product [Rhizophagus irregularis]